MHRCELRHTQKNVVVFGENRGNREAIQTGSNRKQTICQMIYKNRTNFPHLDVNAKNDDSHIDIATLPQNFSVCTCKLEEELCEIIEHLGVLNYTPPPTKVERIQAECAKE